MKYLPLMQSRTFQQVKSFYYHERKREQKLFQRASENGEKYNVYSE